MARGLLPTAAAALLSATRSGVGGTVLPCSRRERVRRPRWTSESAPAASCTRPCSTGPPRRC